MSERKKIMRGFAAMHSKKDGSDENTAKSDGVSLEQGSRAHQDMMFDKEGYDPFEQDKLRREVEASLEADDEWHREREEQLAAAPVQIQKKRSEMDSPFREAARRLNISERGKEIVGEERIKDMKAAAKETEDKSDDKFAKRTAPESLKKMIYDRSVSKDDVEDDFYPGSKILNKYQ